MLGVRVNIRVVWYVWCACGKILCLVCGVMCVFDVGESYMCVCNGMVCVCSIFICAWWIRECICVVYCV